MYFQNLTIPKMWLDIFLNSALSKHPSTVNMLKRPKHLWSLHESTFIIFYFTFRETDSENVSLSDMWNLKTICDHIDCRW